MQVKDLKVNQLIDISVHEEGSSYKNLASRIEEITSQYLHVSIPMKKGQLIPIRVRQNILIGVNYKGRSFQFETVVVQRILHPIPILVVNKPESFREIQRRQWVRVPASILMRYCEQAQSKETEPGPIYEATTVDISGGGICFLTRYPVEAGQILDIEINLPNRDPVLCQLKVLRILEKASKEGDISKAVSEFYDISENQRDRIVSFVFEKQREWIRKGLI